MFDKPLPPLIKNLLIGVALLILAVAGWFLPADSLKPMPAAISSGISHFNAIETTGALQTNGTLIFEGATANTYETTITATDPTADNAVTLPNIGGTIMLASSAYKTVWGSDTITATLAVTHGLTTPLYAFCTLGADPTNGEESHCSVAISSSTVTVKVWKEDLPAAGDSGILVYWSVVGTP